MLPGGTASKLVTAQSKVFVGAGAEGARSSENCTPAAGEQAAEFVASWWSLITAHSWMLA